MPIAALEAKLFDGMSRVAETRMGLVQHFPDRSEASESIAVYGEYLQPLLDALAPLVKPGMTVIEVGAGAGLHALWLSRALGSDGHLLLYEPDGRQRQVLKQNLSANDVTNATVMRRSLNGEAAASPADRGNHRRPGPCATGLAEDQRGSRRRDGAARRNPYAVASAAGALCHA